jgi:adenosylcobinamide amidohydrolase
MKKTLTRQASLDHTPNHIHVEFSVPHQVMSSAVLNGGIVQASHIVNLRVPKRCTATETAEVTLSKYSMNADWGGTVVGMMTAASMDSFRMTKESVEDIDVVVLVTAGLSNPRRVGDRAEHREMATQSEKTGTINIVAMTSAILTEPAMVEALLIVTEAKAAALQEAGIKSPISNKIATGTGTDAVAVVSGHGPETVCHCGKHVLFGEILGRLVTNAVASSIKWDLTYGADVTT